jgi:hypothetical protein
VQIRADPWQRFFQNKCGPGQPPEPHRSWISCLAFPPLGAAGRRYRSDSAHQERHFYQYWLQNTILRIRILRITSLQPLRWPAAQFAQRASCRGGRNARATGSALARVSNFPRQFTLENCQLPPASPQSFIRQASRFATYSLNPLSGRMLRPATEKLLPLVQKLWTIGLPCGSLRKTRRNLGARNEARRFFNNLDAVKKCDPAYSAHTAGSSSAQP